MTGTTRRSLLPEGLNPDTAPLPRERELVTVPPLDFRIPPPMSRGGSRYREPERTEAARLATRKRGQLMYRYGITADEFNERYDAQRGRCGICDQPFSKTPCVDHDHKTGKVRGLLCRPCNVGLGWFENNEEAMIEWLSR